MAPYTVGRRPFELVADVAGGAFQRRMHASERKAGVLQVIEAHSEPTVEVVALIASCRKSCTGVNGSCGRLKVDRMAGITLRRKSLKLAYRRALVAGITIQGRMRS